MAPLRSPLRLLAFACCAAGLLFPLPAPATVVKALTMREHAERSQLIIEGTVVSNTGALHPRLRRPVTDSLIAVHRVHKGPRLTEVTVRQLRGMARGELQRVIGDGELPVGAEVVLFLRQGNDERWYLTALALSVYHVEPITGDPLVKRELSEVRVMPNGEAAEPEPTTLTELRAAIAKALGDTP